MTIKDDIKAAASLLDPTNDSHWTAEGLPSLAAIRTLAGDDKIKEEEVERTLGDSVRRPVASKPIEPPVEPPAPQVDHQASAAAGANDKPEEIGEPDYAAITASRVKEAKQALEVINPALFAAEKAKAEAEATIRDLTQKRDATEGFIEANTKQLTLAESVKRIQQQTQASAAASKARMALAADALKVAGVVPYPSKLDAQMANRIRTPEQKINATKFIHQGADARLKERMGQA